MPLFLYTVRLSPHKRLACRSYFDPFELAAIWQRRTGMRLDFAMEHYTPSQDSYQIEVRSPSHASLVRFLATLYDDFSAHDFYLHALRVSPTTDPSCVNYYIRNIRCNQVVTWEE